jgi:hypothetical protein
MDLNDPTVVIRTLEANYGIIKRQVEGLTHEDSLLQLPFRGNCLNWVVGHIVMARGRMLKLMQLDPVLTPEQAQLYETGSNPITDGGVALRFESLLECLDAAHQQLIAALRASSVEDLGALIPDSERTVGEQLRGLAWHETYHTGQTEILRQLSGINDKVI